MSALISELDPKDIPEACQLFKNVFGQPISPHHWRWKYTEGPRLGSVNIVARADGGELLGHAGASVFPGGLRSEELSMAQVCDMMIGSAARGGLETSSVYHQLFRALQDTMRTRFANPYAYGFAGARVFRLGTRMGYYRETQRYRPGYVTPPKAMGWSAAMWRTQEVDWDIARIDRIWTRFRNKLERPTLYRTGPYLAWRYRDHPIHRYRLWVLSHLARDRGWFVTRAMPDGEICIVDALIPESADPSPLAATLAIALAKASAQVAPIYAWFLPSCDTQEDEPGIGGEFRVNPWHTQDPNPRFQPGDTDVY